MAEPLAPLALQSISGGETSMPLICAHQVQPCTAVESSAGAAAAILAPCAPIHTSVAASMHTSAAAAVLAPCTPIQYTHTSVAEAGTSAMVGMRDAWADPGMHGQTHDDAGKRS